MVGCFHDVTERKAAEEKLSAMARYDLLTGLANRHIFVDALDQAISDRVAVPRASVFCILTSIISRT